MLDLLRDKWPCSRRAAEQRDELASRVELSTSFLPRADEVIE
jgi:hypothetical protein